MMTSLSQFFLTLLGVLFCADNLAALGFVLSWQARGASPDERRSRWLRGVLPATVALLGLLLLALVQMLLWTR